VNFLFGTVSSAGALAWPRWQAGEGRHDDHHRLDRRRDEGQVEPDTPSVPGWAFPGSELSRPLHGRKSHPKLTKFYNIGPDYEYGRTMWELFKAKMKEQNPKAEFTGEQWPKLATPDYTSYINAILQAKPEAVFLLPVGRRPRGVLQAGQAVRTVRQDEVDHRDGRRRGVGESDGERDADRDHRPTSGTTSTGRTARGTRTS